MMCDMEIRTFVLNRVEYVVKISEPNGLQVVPNKPVTGPRLCGNVFGWVTVSREQDPDCVVRTSAGYVDRMRASEREWLTLTPEDLNSLVDVVFDEIEPLIFTFTFWVDSAGKAPFSPDRIPRFSCREGMPYLHDVVFRLGDQTFPCHKVIVANQCDVWKTLFQTPMREMNEGTVVIGADVDEKAFELFLQMVYGFKPTGRSVVEHAEDLLFLADHVQAKTVGVRIERELCKAVSVNNALQLLMLSFQWRKRFLFSKCVVMYGLYRSQLCGTKTMRQMYASPIGRQITEYLVDSVLETRCENTLPVVGF